jgi:hypothetical protein
MMMPQGVLLYYNRYVLYLLYASPLQGHIICFSSTYMCGEDVPGGPISVTIFFGKDCFFIGKIAARVYAHRHRA